MKKKNIFCLISLLLIFGIVSCEGMPSISLENNLSSGSSIILSTDISEQKVQLRTPTEADYEDGKIVWKSVENAVSYVIEVIPYNEESISYSRSKNYLELDFNDTTMFQYRIRAIADTSTNYIDSNWTNYFEGKYVKTSEDILYSAEYRDRGLGRTVNLLSENGSYRDFETRCLDALDQEKLKTLKVGKKNIREGKFISQISNSLDEKADSYSRDINAKLNVSIAKPNDKKILCQKGFGLNTEYHNKYVKKSKDKTKMYFYDMENEYQAEEYYFEGGLNKNIFANALSDQFLDDASEIEANPNNKYLIESFIQNYGTHLITSAIYGAALSVHYSLIGTESGVEEQTDNDFLVDLNASVGFVQVGTSGGTNISESDVVQRDDVNINLDIDFLGGKNQGFQTSFTENNLNSFNDAYSKWAESTNDPDYYSFIDVGNQSLICLWDLLDNEKYAETKVALNAYLDEVASDAYRVAEKKINQFFDENYSFQNGTFEYPYLIETETDFSDIIREHNDSAEASDVYYAMTRDLDFSKIEYFPIDKFRGHLLGNDYTIRNLRLDVQYSDGFTLTSYGSVYAGLFQYVYGTVQDLNVLDANITADFSESYLRVGILSGGLSEGGSVINCSVSGTIDARGAGGYNMMAGGMIGRIDDGTMKKCSSTVNLNVVNNDISYVGGVVGSGYMKTILDRCHYNGKIKATCSSSDSNDRLVSGGIVGVLSPEENVGKQTEIYGKSLVQNSYSEGTIFADSTDKAYVTVGGLAGLIQYTTIVYCYSAMDVTGKSKKSDANIGGLIGESYQNSSLISEIKYSFATGNVYAYGNYSGAEKNNSYWGPIYSKKNSQTLLNNLYYNVNYQYKDGKTGTEKKDSCTATSIQKIQTTSFQRDTLKLSEIIWNLSDNSYPTLREGNNL